MKSTELTIEKMNHLDAMIDGLTLVGGCQVLPIIKREILSTFSKENANYALSFTDDEGNELSFRASFTELCYVYHRVDRRLENPDGYKDEYDEMKDVLQMFNSEDAEEEK